MNNIPDTVIVGRCVYDANGKLVGHEPMRIRPEEVIEYFIQDDGGITVVVAGRKGCVGFIEVRENAQTIARLTDAPINLNAGLD